MERVKAYLLTPIYETYTHTHRLSERGNNNTHDGDDF